MKFNWERAKGSYVFFPPKPEHRCQPPGSHQLRADKVRFGTIWRCDVDGKRFVFGEFGKGDTPEYSRGAWYAEGGHGPY